MNERVEMVRDAYAAAAERGYLDTDWGWFFDRVATDDIELRTAGAYLDARPLYRGRDGWKEFWEGFTDAWQSWSIELEDISEPREGIVLALIRVIGAGYDSGITSDRKEAHAWWFRGERICRIAAFAEREDAYRELGLSM